MNFSLLDPCPGIRLAEIRAPLSRAQAWVSRTQRDPTFDDSLSVQIIGALHILEGMDYHFQAYMAHVHAGEGYIQRRHHFFDHIAPQQVAIDGRDIPRRSNQEAFHLNALHHEAVAYLNRMGQFFFFARQLGKLSQIPRLCELMPFRNKYTAHRSIDEKRGEGAGVQEHQAMAFHFNLYTLKGVIRFQIPVDGGHLEFCPPEDHPVLITQAVDLLLNLHTTPELGCP